MRHSSDQINAILTSPEGKKIIDYVSPIYDEAYVALWLFQTMGIELDEMQGWVKSLWQEIVPQTTLLLLYCWEKEYGIPTDTTLPLLQRRNTLLARIRNRAPINPHRLRTIVTAVCGLPSRIAENVAKNTFHIYISALGSEGVDEAAVKHAVDKIKPAHLFYQIKYEQGVQSNLFAVFTTHKAVTFVGKQVN